MIYLDNINDLPRGEFNATRNDYGMIFRKVPSIGEDYFIPSESYNKLADTFGEEFARFFAEGSKIQCIKIIRGRLGCGLREAKTIFEVLNGEIDSRMIDYFKK